jgi:outer membrane protein assembly factor BamE (lipoprotein component of BamABCDE complex)
MPMTGRIARHAALAVMLMLTVACAPVFRNHGYAPSEDDLTDLVVGESTRDDVARIVGRPSASGVMAGSGWYYVSSRFRHIGARAPQEIDRQVVAISFSEDGIVENVERFGLEDGQVVALSRRVTESNIKGVSFLRQLFGNIGRFTAGQFADN